MSYIVASYSGGLKELRIPPVVAGTYAMSVAGSVVNEEACSVFIDALQTEFQAQLAQRESEFATTLDLQLAALRTELNDACDVRVSSRARNVAESVASQLMKGLYG